MLIKLQISINMWNIIFCSNREELVKIIRQLKSGEEVTPVASNNKEEDSSSAEIPPQVDVKQVRIFLTS